MHERAKHTMKTPLLGEVFQNTTMGIPTKAVRQTAIAQDALKGIRQGYGILRRHQQARLTVSDEVTGPRNVCGD